MGANSSWDKLTLLQQLTQAVLHKIEASGPLLLTANDVFYLSQMMDVTPPARFHSAGDNATEVMVSIATNYLNIASLILEPRMASQWMGLTDDGVRRNVSVTISL